MDGMTGYSPEVAEANILDFYSNFDGAEGHLFETFEVLFDNLIDLWASPKAVEFGNNYSPLINDLLRDCRANCCAIVKNAMRAYNTISSAHGGKTISIELWETPFVGEFRLLDSKDGIVGMNVMQVRLAADDFNSRISNLVLSRLNELPMDIAFYDPSGEQKAAYQAAIKKVRDKIVTITENINKDINSFIETEENTIMLAKQQATEAMNG